MKKTVSVILAVVIILSLAITMCSCQARECDFCGERKSESDMRKSHVDGVTYYMCDDCYHELEESIFNETETD